MPASIKVVLAMNAREFVCLERPCPTCQQQSLHGARIRPDKSLLDRGLALIDATRCFSCGDVRLIGCFDDKTDKHEIRGELDCLAMLLSEVAEDELRATRN